MASLQDIRRRITSVKNTRKITKALELVAGARLRRAQTRIEEMRPYADRMQELMVGTARAASSFRNLALHAAARREDASRSLVVTGDRGLAGPFNGQVLRRAFELERQERAEGHEIAWTRHRPQGRVDAPLPPLRADRAVGGLRRQADVRRRAGGRAPARRALHDERGRPRRARLQPLRVGARAARDDHRPAADPRGACSRPSEDMTAREEALRGDFIYEPEPEEILERLLPVYLETEIYRALLESAASFLAAQMTAMRNASKNAGELIDTLHAADEPRPPGADHPGDPRDRRRRGRADAVADARSYLFVANSCRQYARPTQHGSRPSRRVRACPCVGVARARRGAVAGRAGAAARAHRALRRVRRVRARRGRADAGAPHDAALERPSSSTGMPARRRSSGRRASPARRRRRRGRDRGRPRQPGRLPLVSRSRRASRASSAVHAAGPPRRRAARRSGRSALPGTRLPASPQPSEPVGSLAGACSAFG